MVEKCKVVSMLKSVCYVVSIMSLVILAGCAQDNDYYKFNLDNNFNIMSE